MGTMKFLPRTSRSLLANMGPIHWKYLEQTQDIKKTMACFRICLGCVRSGPLWRQRVVWAQINSRYSGSVERGHDLLWAWSQCLLPWLSYPWTKFFFQLTDLWTFCFSPVKAPRYWLLPTPRYSWKLLTLFYICCYGHYCLFQSETASFPSGG